VGIIKMFTSAIDSFSGRNPRTISCIFRNLLTAFAPL
jgi:hypothetical protein